MLRKLLIAISLVALPAVAAADSQWVLDQCTLTYHVSHPLHQVDGVSHAAKGKGVCHNGECDLLIAVAVKSFDSGDSNRDLHMLQVTRGAQFPLVMVRTRLPESSLGAPLLTLICKSSSPVRRWSTSRFPSNRSLKVTRHASREPSRQSSRSLRSTRRRS